jgi:hypothetical protein
MNISTMAAVFGVVFLLVGIVGFFPSPPPADAPPLTVAHGHGLALGLFPVNTLHNVVHLLFGLLGLMAAAGMRLTARAYFRFLTIAYAALVVLGLLPATQTTFGLIPIYGNDVWLHGVVALAAAYLGFVAPAAPVRTATT